MAKTLFPDMSRGTTSFRADPRKLVIIGGRSILDIREQGPGDTEHKSGEHRLWRSGLDTPIPDTRMASFRRDGIRVQPTVMKGPNGEALVVAGATRVRGARLLAHEAEKAGGEPYTIEVMAIKDEEAAERMVGIENYQRKTMLTGDILRDVAEKDKDGWSHEDIATYCALDTPHYVKQLLRFIKRATPKLREAVESGKLTLVAGLELAKLEGAKQEEALATALEAPVGRSGGAGLKAAKEAKAAAEGKSVSAAPGKKVLKKVYSGIDHDIEEAAKAGSVRELDDDAQLATAKEVLNWVLTGEGPRWLLEYTGVVPVEEKTEDGGSEAA